MIFVTVYVLWAVEVCSCLGHLENDYCAVSPHGLPIFSIQDFIPCGVWTSVCSAIGKFVFLCYEWRAYVSKFPRATWTYLSWQTEPQAVEQVVPVCHVRAYSTRVQQQRALVNCGRGNFLARSSPLCCCPCFKKVAEEAK